MANSKLRVTICRIFAYYLPNILRCFERCLKNKQASISKSQSPRSLSEAKVTEADAFVAARVISRALGCVGMCCNVSLHASFCLEAHLLADMREKLMKRSVFFHAWSGSHCQLPNFQEVLFNFRKPSKKKGFDPNWKAWPRPCIFCLLFRRLCSHFLFYISKTATRQRPFPKYIVMGGVMMTFVGVGPQISHGLYERLWRTLKLRQRINNDDSNDLFWTPLSRGYLGGGPGSRISCHTWAHLSDQGTSFNSFLKNSFVWRVRPILSAVWGLCGAGFGCLGLGLVNDRVEYSEIHNKLAK